LNVIDDGYLPGVQGNSKYDDEGTLRRRTYLIRHGVLEGFMHSRETAARMGAQPTGNARAVAYTFAPIVRMRNTHIDNGPASFEQMLQGIDYGIYACDPVGGQTELEQFTFGSAASYEIINGQLGGLLRDVTLTGNVFETLNNIEMIGNDLTIQGSSGGCGKGEQFPLPLTTGSPHVRVRNLTVGGKA
jgi:TldD protein